MTFKKYFPFFIIFLFFTAGFSFSQTFPVIHVGKRGFTFFKNGAKSDTLIKNKSDLFTLWISDTLKKDLVLLTENGRFEKTNTDGVIRFVYLPGLKYESLFLKAEPNHPFEFKSLINGASTLEPNKVLIQLMNKREGKIILENVFFYLSS